MSVLRIAGLAAALILSMAAYAARAQSPAANGHQHHHVQAPPAGACAGVELKCALTATPTFDSGGRLWVVWTAAGKVWVAHETAAGGGLQPGVAVTPQPVRLDTGPDSRPKLAIDANGRVAVAFAVLPESVGYNGQIFTARSTDGGAAFSQPVRLDPASPGHRFEALQFLPDGRLLVATIDKANAVAAKKAGTKYAGAALALAWSTDGGTTFTPAKAVVDQSCECCRIAIALDPKGVPVIAFRNIFGGTTRDHAVITVAADGTTNPVRRVSEDQWVTDTCPHQGPALAVAKTGSYHVAWYTAGNNRKGVFYARSTDAGVTFSSPLAIGRAGAQVSRPQLLAANGMVYLAWKEFDGETSKAVAQVSHDDGATWSAPLEVATTQSRADHPQLVINGRGAVYLSWLTDNEGHRLLPVGSGS